MGDIARASSTRIKYRYFFDALERKFQVLDVYDARERGLARVLTALRTIHPERRRWRERFYKNAPSFRRRSRLTAAHIRSFGEQADVVFQIGVLFDARWDDGPTPNVIYADYTAYLSAQTPDAGRSPFTARERAEWIAMERRAFERAAHICARSALARRSIIEHYGIAPERVSVVGGGVNFAALPELPAPDDARPPTVLFIGRDLYRKGGDQLLRAFALVRRQLPEARLLFLTADPIPAELPLAGVELVDPAWNRARVEDLYRRADVFVLPSRLETWGDVLLEAMAFGLPCVGVAGEAMEEIIVPGETGQIVLPGDIDALAGAIACLLCDPELRRAWGRNARRRVEDEFTWEHVVERIAPAIELAAGAVTARR